jgi:hypothetical protein
MCKKSSMMYSGSVLSYYRYKTLWLSAQVNRITNAENETIQFDKTQYARPSPCPTLQQRTKIMAPDSYHVAP